MKKNLDGVKVFCCGLVGCVIGLIVGFSFIIL